MANQMIALQTRNPQLPDPSRAAAQYANMMNMASQQRATQLQAERTRQEMDYARAGEGRAIETQIANMREKDLAIEDKELMRLYKIGAAILETEDPTAREAAYQNLLGMIEDTSPQLGATMRQVAGTFNAPVLQSVMMETEQYFNKKYTTPTNETAFGPNDEILEVTRGGLPGVAGVRPLLNMPPQGAPASPAAAPRTPTAPAPAGAPMRATRGANTTPQDLMQQGMDPRNIPSGMPTARPISFNQSDMGGAGQMSPDMVPAILDSAINTGVMAQIDLDQMLAMTPPQARQGIVDVLRSNNVSLQADAPSLAASAMGQQQPMAPNPVQRPEARFANLPAQPMRISNADLGGKPQMRNVMAQTNVVGQQAYGRSGSATSPLPGSSQVPLPRVAGEAAAEEGGKQGVRVKVEPVIAGATKSAQLRAEKDASFSDAQSQFDAAWSTVSNRLSDIKRFRKHPAATRVIGPLDAFTPNFGRARGAQQIYDTLVASATFDALQEMRVNSPTGGALGNVSDADIRLLKESIGALGQAQNEEDFFESLRIYEERLMQVRDRLEKRYRQSYGYRLGNNWKPPVTTSRPRTPTNAGRKAGAFTVMEVDE